MDNNNLAIVRIINEAPLDKTIRPISNVHYLRKMKGTEITFAIHNMIKRAGLLEHDDFSDSPENMAVRARNSEIENQFLPLSSAYNSMTLWTINGPMAEETAENGTAFAGNTYSDRNCAIVDYLMPHIEEIASINPIDLAIHDNTQLSAQGRVIVTKEYFDNLPYDKQQLIANDNQFEVVDGPITEAVNDTLSSMGITPEKMSLSRDDEGFKPSETSETVKQSIERLSHEYDIPNVRHFNLLQGIFDPHKKLEFAKKEFDRMLCVETFYQRTFIDYISKNMNLDPRTIDDCLYMHDSEVYIEKLFDEIKEKGLDNFKKLVTDYNNSLFELKQMGKLPTPQQIVDVKATNKDNFNTEQQLSNELCNISSMEM